MTTKTAYAQITNGLYRNQTINGVFKMHTKISDVQPDDEGNITMMLSNFKHQDPIAVTFNLDDMDIVHSGFKWGHTESEVASIIEERFDAFHDLTTAVMTHDSDINSLVVVGAPGIGKTYNLEKALNTAEAEVGQSFDIVGGSATKSGLYSALFRNRFPGQILVLDDCDSVFDDRDAVNLLKKALDSSAERWVSNLTMSKDLKEMGVPNKFKFEGRVIFISNINFFKEIERGTKISVHLKALIDRATMIDLMIHDPRSVMLHVENVVRKSSMFESLGLTSDHMEMALKFLNENVNELTKLSIRTPLEIGKIMRISPNWERMVKVTQTKPQSIIWAD